LPDFRKGFFPYNLVILRYGERLNEKTPFEKLKEQLLKGGAEIRDETRTGTLAAKRLDNL